MIHKLRQLQKEGGCISVGVTGLGAMGTGVAKQVAHTVGMEVAFVADTSQVAADRLVSILGKKPIAVTSLDNLPPRKVNEEVYTIVGVTAFILAALEMVSYDALCECTNSIYEAFLYCKTAIAKKAHVVLMNAEVDLILGTTLAIQAKEKGVVVTSDAGDQHGVLATMIDEIQLFGFEVVQAGNMKGFMKRDADAEHARPWAEKQKGSVVQTVCYTDGTKMNIEQAIIGNYAGLIPFCAGMEGPKISDIRQTVDEGVFSLEKYDGVGRVDYTVGVGWPGGGVYVIGKCEDDAQHFLMDYYKVTYRRPYYLFFRPYHLCHLETPRAIAQCYFDNRAVICPPLGKKLNDVYAYAKKDLAPGDIIQHAFGGDELYGMVDACAVAEPQNHLPACYVEPIHHNGSMQHAIVKNAKKKDEPILWGDIEIPDTPYYDLLKAQNGR